MDFYKLRYLGNIWYVGEERRMAASLNPSKYLDVMLIRPNGVAKI